MKRTMMAGTALLASALLLSACGTAGGGGGGGTDGMPTELGKTEGAVSILAWPGYVEDGSNDPAVDWVSGFEDATGCTVTSKTYGTSDEAFNLMKSGDYDVVAASGDASLRLVAAKEVAPVNTDLLKNYDGIFDFLKMQ
jgi:putative spermidine/putrescine transport system substrate-binding protein